MADRTVNVRLRLDTTGFLAGTRQAEGSLNRLATQSTAAANAASRGAQQAATAAGGTFSNVNRQADRSLQGLQRSAGRTSQAISTSSATMSRETARAATQAAAATNAAIGRSAASATAATRQVSAAAGGIPATFRAAGATASTSLQQMARDALTSRAALTSSLSTVTRVQTEMSAATAAAAAGTSRLSLASRLALGEAATASQAAVAAATASAARLSTSAALAAAGATRASEAAATGAAAAAARSAAATSGAFARVSSRAGAMGASVAAAAGRSERSLKAVRNVSLGLVAVFAAAVYAAANFDKAMSEVRAVTNGSADDMNKLKDAALQAGQSTRYSASQAANAEAELARAGVSTADIVSGALSGSLSLAASGQLELGESAIIAAQAMNSFKLQGKDVGHIADVISAGAGKSATDVHAMGLAFRQAALVANQTGLSLEDTVGSLALFAQNALVGSDAGTSLKVMLQRLTPQSKEAADLMHRLGFTAFDSQGQFVGLSETAQRLKNSFSNLTPEARNAAFATIFGSDAVRAATILYQQGSSGVDSWTKAVNDSGYASRVAATMTDNLSGDLHKLKSALETALIQSGSAANGVLRGMAKTLTDVVRWYNELPSGVQKSVTILSGLLGVVGLVGASMLLMLPRIMAVRAELVRLGVTAAGTRTAMMALGRMTVVLGALAALSYASDKLSNAMKEAPPNVTKLTSELVKLGQSGKATAAGVSELDDFGDAVARIAHPSTLDRITDVGSSILHLGGDSTVFGISEARDKIHALDESLAQLVSNGSPEIAAKAFAKMAAEAEANGTSTEKLKTMLPQYADALTALDTQNKLTTGSQKGLGDQAETTADALADQRTEAEKLTDALNALNGVNISEAQAAIGFQQSLHDLRDAVKDNGHSLDITSEKGRKVKSAFLDAAKAAQEHGQAVAEQTQNQDKGRAALEKDISALKRTMRQAGFTEAQIKSLTKAYATLPAKSATQVKAETGQAMHDLEAVQSKVKGTKGKTIEVKALTAAGQKALEDLGYKVSRTKGKKIVITVPTGTQKANVDALAAAIRALHDKSIVIKTTHYNNTVTSGGGLGKKNAASARANGGVFDYYADGGMRENHVAQIARAGEWRVWAEDETGGEAYIPLAMSKRARSRQIAEETVRRLGGRGVEWYAKGGLTQSQKNARKELPGDFGDFTRSLTKSASEIKSAAGSLATDLKKLGNAGWKLAQKVDATSRKLQTLAGQRDKVKDQIAEAKQFASTEKGSIKDFLGVEGGGTATDLIAQMQAEQATTTKFQKDIGELQRRGLNKDLLRQVIDQGPDSALAKTLLSASPGQLKQINALAGSGSKLATSIGNLTADALYDAGSQAGKGFLAGLQAQEKALQAQMDKLGQSLVKAIKKSLKIKSPSQVMRDQVGVQLGAGLVQGMDRTLVDVTAAATRMSAASIPGAFSAPASTAALPSTFQLTGDLYLDSGEFLGKVRGVAAPMIKASEDRQAFRATAGRRR